MLIHTYRQIRQIITPEEHRRLLWLTIPVCLFALLNVVGVGVVVPFIAVASNPDVIHQNAWLSRLYDLFHFQSSSHFLVFLGLVSFAMLLIVNVGGAVVTWLNARVSNKLGVSLGERLLSTYLYQPYAFFLNHNSASLSQRVLNMVVQVKTGVVFNGMTFCSNCLVIGCLIALLLVADVKVALSAILLVGVVYFGIYFMVRQRLGNISNDQSVLGQKAFKAVSEAFGGIKDISLMGHQAYFIRQYIDAASVISQNAAHITCIQSIPRYVFELLAFGGLLLMIVAFEASGKNLAQLLPLLSVFVYAGYRLLPASQAMLNAFTQFKANHGVLDVLYHDFKLLSVQALNSHKSTIVRLPFQNAITLRAASFAYGKGASNVLDQVSLKIMSNQVVGIIGATGAGKTTLVDVLLGLLVPTEGSLQVDGVTIDRDNVQRWQKQLGYVSQHIYLSDDTIANNIAFGVAPDRIDHDQVIRVAKAAAIHDFIQEDLPNQYDTEIGERGVRLSGGQRQRIGIARALYHNPSVLVLDEATSALDGATEGAVMDAIHALAHQKTIIIIAHRLTTVAQCDSVFLMSKGRILDQGSFDQLLERHPSVRDMANLAVE